MAGGKSCMILSSCGTAWVLHNKRGAGGASNQRTYREGGGREGGREGPGIAGFSFFQAVETHGLCVGV